MVEQFSLYSRTRNEEQSPYSSLRVFSIESHQELLNTPLRRKLITKIKKLSKAPDDYFKALYEPVLQTVANYLQTLPDLRTYGTPHSTTWLDSALARTAYAMTVRHRITLPHQGTPEEVKKDYALWTYVVFSSSLLWHIGKLNTHFTIALCDDLGKVAGHWNPMRNSLMQAGQHYKIRNLDKNGPATFKQMTTVLARHIMPHDGFEWIASNEKALEEWLLALVEETGSQGQLICVLELAQKILEDQIDKLEEFELLHKKLEKELRDLEDELHSIKELEEALRKGEELPPVTINEPPDTKIGEEFVRWLQKGLANRTIPFNTENAHVCLSPDGVILAYPELFQDFCSMFYRHQNWITVYKQFNYLGMHKKSGVDTWFGKFFLDSAQVDLSGSTLGINNRKEFTALLVEQPQTLLSHRQLQQKQQVTAKLAADSPPIPKNEEQYPTLTQRGSGLGFKDKR